MRVIAASLGVGLAASLIAASHNDVELDPAMHEQLLLNGRPQVGLWKALLQQAEQDSLSR